MEVEESVSFSLPFSQCSELFLYHSSVCFKPKLININQSRKIILSLHL